jgi:hypothetical protein
MDKMSFYNGKRLICSLYRSNQIQNECDEKRLFGLLCRELETCPLAAQNFGEFSWGFSKTFNFGDFNSYLNLKP